MTNSMKNENAFKALWATSLVLLVIVSLPLFIASIISLLEPIAVWIFILIVVFLALSFQGLFEKSEPLTSRILFFVFSVTLLLTFWYFYLRPE